MAVNESVEDADGQPVAGIAMTIEAAPEEPACRTGLLDKLAFVIGSVGLLVATASDALAVLGRHVGFTLLGSIEIVQLAVVLVASAAMIGATLQGSHASVHIFTERMSTATRGTLGRITSLFAALLFLAIAFGSAWIARDLWDGHERTELLFLPLRWFRLIWIGACLMIAALFAKQGLLR